jgi:hypothetical protein
VEIATEASDAAVRVALPADVMPKIGAERRR